MAEINHYGEALSALESAQRGANVLDAKEAALYHALLASAHANLAAYDAVVSLRDHVESLPARLQRTLGDR